MSTLRRITLVTVPVISGATAFGAGKYASGDYAFTNTPQAVLHKFNHTKEVQKYVNDPQYKPLAYQNNLSELSQPQTVTNGGVSEPYFAFVDSQNPKNTVTFVHCGPRSVGFPLIVHGGLLCSLMRQSVVAATKENELLKGKFVVKYRNPTIYDSIVKIETSGTKEGLDLRITYPHDPKKVLVEATYTR